VKNVLEMDGDDGCTKNVFNLIGFSI
jgi:hypothetical protein